MKVRGENYKKKKRLKNDVNQFSDIIQGHKMPLQNITLHDTNDNLRPLKIIKNTCSYKLYYSKPVLNGQSKVDKTKVLKTGGSLVQVRSIAECFSIVQYF